MTEHVNTLQGMVHELNSSDFNQLSAYRHKVFIETLGWTLQTQVEHELDQFDRPDTRYIIVKDNAGHICGCARLLPTTLPYLLGEIFPQLLNGQAHHCVKSLEEVISTSTTPPRLKEKAQSSLENPHQYHFGNNPNTPPLTIKWLWQFKH